MKIQMTRERRIILVVGGILLSLAMVYLFLPSIQSAFPSQEAIELKRHKLSKYRAKVQDKKALDLKLRALQQAIKRSESGLLQGKTASLAAVEVQQVVSEIIKSVGGQIRTTRILSPSQESQENYKAIPIEISIQGTLGQLVDILYQIYTTDKVLRMAEIGIRSVGARSENQTILSTMTVEGFMKMSEG